MLIDLLCASASIEPVRRDFELMDAVQHCRNQVAFRAKLISFCGSPSLLRCSASACISIVFLIYGCFDDNPDNSLTERGSETKPQPKSQWRKISTEGAAAKEQVVKIRNRTTANEPVARRTK